MTPSDPIACKSIRHLQAALAQRRSALVALSCAVLLGGCVTADRPDDHAPSPAESHALISRLLPARTADRVGWATDIFAAFSALKIVPTADNVCAVVAITEQESSFRASPTVPGLGKIAWKEIDDRAQSAGIPVVVVHTALRISSPDGRSYSERIDKATTEQELSEVFEDLIGLVPMGKTLFGRWNPVRTGGPMQVSIAFAREHAQSRPYPYPAAHGIRHEVFTRHGGMYFGIAHLLDYPAAYDKQLYRFADFNAGHYASRNAAFQNALSIVSGKSLALDGDLVNPATPQTAGATESASRSLGAKLKLSDADIRSALEQGLALEFEQTSLYEQVFALADRQAGKRLPRAVVPRIRLKGPKISRNLTTAWFAERVEGRYRQCLARDVGPRPDPG